MESALGYFSSSNVKNIINRMMLGIVNISDYTFDKDSRMLLSENNSLVFIIGLTKDGFIRRQLNYSDISLLMEIPYAIQRIYFLGSVLTDFNNAVCKVEEKDSSYTVVYYLQEEGYKDRVFLEERKDTILKSSSLKVVYKILGVRAIDEVLMSFEYGLSKRVDLGLTATKRKFRCLCCGKEYQREGRSAKHGFCRECHFERGDVVKYGYLDEVENKDLYQKLSDEFVVEKFFPFELSKAYVRRVNLRCPRCGRVFGRDMCDVNEDTLYCNKCEWNIIALRKNGSVANFPFICEWDYTKNTVDPKYVNRGDETEYWWICPSGHSYKCSPNVRRLAKRSGYNYRNCCPECFGRKLHVGGDDYETVRKSMVQYWADEEKKPCDVTYGSAYVATWRCSSCGRLFKRRVADVVSTCLCLNCKEGFKSAFEKELFDFVKSLGFSPRSNVRMKQKEIDIYIEEKNIGFECNGVYWHNEDLVGSEYHKEKWDVYQDLGIDVYAIWEDDYTNRKELVYEFIRRKLGVSNHEKVGARQCLVFEEYDYPLISTFLCENHIQKSIKGCLYVSLRQEKELVALAVFNKAKNSEGLVLSRYATSKIVQGGLGKILEYIKRNYHYKYIETFSDRMYSNGELYKELGFKVLYDIPEDYCYVVNGSRVHKFNYRKDRFRRDPKLYYEEGLTERDLADYNGMSRIWDAGKVKWRLELKEK